jgi:hypothetical protein
LTSALTDQGPYEFAVSGAEDDYIDLANTYLFVDAQIMDDDDAALDGGTDVGPVNLWMHSRPFITRCPGGFTVSIAFWSKFLLLISIVILLPV